VCTKCIIMEILMFKFLSIIKVACLLQGRNDFGRARMLFVIFNLYV